MAGIVGETGHVWAIDDDSTNAEAMERYKRINNIDHLSVVKTGVWKEKGVQEFILFRDYTSSNAVCSVFEGFREGVGKRWGERRIKERSTILSIEVDTLDSIVVNETGNDRIDFIDITVNGAEGDVLGGAQETLEKNPDIKVTFPLVNISPCALDHLRDMGFIVAIADAPHRPWDEEQFLFGCAMRAAPEYLLSRGFRPVRLNRATTLSDDGVGCFTIEET